MNEELPRVGAEVAGYRILSPITRGGMAVVYLAEDLRLGRKVALKILASELAEDDDFRTRFLRESQTAASIDHPNVIPIYDAGESHGHLYIAMRVVNDTDLKGLLKSEPRLEIDRATSIASQVAGALGAAHRHDLVHRDVKPANILIIRRDSPGSNDHAYLSDFGLAKHVESVSGLTATGHFMGTVNYAAPEQVEGKQVDGRTDIYALGCVLFECLTGRPPFQKEEGVAVIMAHLREEAVPVSSLRPDCPPELDAVVAKMLAKPPADRYQTCAELIEALGATRSRHPRRRDGLGDDRLVPRGRRRRAAVAHGPVGIGRRRCARARPGPASAPRERRSFPGGARALLALARRRRRGGRRLRPRLGRRRRDRLRRERPSRRRRRPARSPGSRSRTPRRRASRPRARSSTARRGSSAASRAPTPRRRRRRSRPTTRRRRRGRTGPTCRSRSTTRSPATTTATSS